MTYFMSDYEKEQVLEDNKYINDLGFNVTRSPYNAKGDGITDDTVAIQNAINSAIGSKVYFPIGNYKITDNIIIPSNIEITGNGKISFASTIKDIFIIYGKNISGQETQNIKISDLEFSGGRYGIQVYGFGYTYKPHNILIEKVKTTGSAGGIYINSAYNIQILNCINDGGNRHIGVFSPITGKTDTYNVQVNGCRTKNTVQFGYQSYYSDRVSFINNTCDGSAEVSGDRSCVTIDRTTNAIVSNNTLINAPASQIYITGVDKVTCSNNVCIGGSYGIQIAYNFENVEDSAIGVSNNVTVNGNVCADNGIAIMLNGVQNVTASANTLRNSTTKSFQIQSSIRVGDTASMTTKFVSINDNVADNGYNNPNVVAGTNLIGNTFTTYTGLQALDVVVDANYASVGFASKILNNFGLLKKEHITDTQRLAEWNLETNPASVHKGMFWSYDYGVWSLRDSANVAMIQFKVGANGGTNGDIIIPIASRGLVVKSPDGQVSKRLGIDNSGALSITDP